ncbi:MAG: protein-glutamate O-methyltransferase, partial [Alphaproteobacteria bacterium]|nr:protein-glutamate O-methyltransferase [Alphaproteobacteria bacterium]
MRTTETLTRDVSNGAIPVCGIGASAGGVEALQSLFAALPGDLGFAYVVVVHLAPDLPSHLRDILAARTAMPVQAVDRTRTRTLATDTVHVVAPDRALTIEGDQLVATPFAEPRCRRTTIDLLFGSLAAARVDAVAVVLSGAGTAGSFGARAIKAAGGIVLVQEPAEADYPTMPASVVAGGSADVVAPLAGLAQRLVELAHNRSVAAASAPGRAESAAELAPIVELVNTRTGHDLSSYKKATLARRVARRMRVTRTASLAAYADHLRENPREARALFDDVMISVTAFFRDGGSFRVLAERALAAVFDRLGAGDEVRAWVVGCATGEEAYSLAMLLLVEAERRGSSVPIQVFATDLDAGALTVARAGRYPASSAAALADAGFDRYFRSVGEHLVVAEAVRDLVVFAEHDVLTDPPFLRLDLVACRNLMIYLERDAQRQLTALFRYALKPGGFLFLGAAETVERDDFFETVHRDARLYRATAGSPRALPALPQFPAVPSVRFRGSSPPTAADRPARSTSAAHLDALERLAPPSALVDARHEVLHLSPAAGRFLVPPAGPFSKDAAVLVREELRVALRRALNRAFEAGEATLTPPMTVLFDGVPRWVVLHVAPRSDGPADARRAVIFFLDGGAADAADATDGGSSALIRRLRAERDAAEERLRASRDQHDRSVRELRAANADLHSLNAEYRSTSEELETSKEELQATNEELRTVNTEMRSKLATVGAANSDLQNLMQATEIATLFVDTGLRIRLFTP